MISCNQLAVGRYGTVPMRVKSSKHPLGSSFFLKSTYQWIGFFGKIRPEASHGEFYHPFLACTFLYNIPFCENHGYRGLLYNFYTIMYNIPCHHSKNHGSKMSLSSQRRPDDRQTSAVQDHDAWRSGKHGGNGATILEYFGFFWNMLSMLKTQLMAQKKSKP